MAVNHLVTGSSPVSGAKYIRVMVILVVKVSSSLAIEWFDSALVGSKTTIDAL